jgi:hypothetical protein
MWQIIFGHTYNKHSILFLKSGVREKGMGGLGRSNGLHMLVKKAGWEKKKESRLALGKREGRLGPHLK